jgi:MFS family permease
VTHNTGGLGSVCTKRVQSMVHGVRYRGNTQRKEPISEGAHIELTEVLLFFIGVIATVIASAVTFSVFPTSRTSYVVAFLLSGIAGGVLTGNPIGGSISGLLGGLFFTSYIDGDETFLWVYLSYFVGGFIGGITGKILCTHAQQVIKKSYLNLKFWNYIGIAVGFLFIASALVPVGVYHLRSSDAPVGGTLWNFMLPTGWFYLIIGIALLFHKRLGLENKQLAFVMFAAGLLFYPLLQRQNVDYWLGLLRGVTGDYDVNSFGFLKLMLYCPFCVGLTSILASLLVMINGRTKSQNHPS